MSATNGIQIKDAFFTEESANSAFSKVMESAPMGLLISAALGLSIVGVFQYIFYLDVLPAAWQSPLRHGISIAIAAFFEALSLFFLITTVRDFSARHRREGWLGAVASLLLLIYALYEVLHVAATFDRDTPETYATIFAILATIIVIVRVVELRIALTVTAAIIRLDERKQIEELTGKLAAYEAEADDIAERKRQAEEAEAHAAQQQREQEIAELYAEVETLRKKVTKQEKTPDANGLDRRKIEKAVRDFYRKADTAPTQAQIANMLRTSSRNLRNYMNGSWQALLEEVTAQPETQPENIEN